MEAKRSKSVRSKVKKKIDFRGTEEYPVNAAIAKQRSIVGQKIEQITSYNNLQEGIRNIGKHSKKKSKCSKGRNTSTSYSHHSGAHHSEAFEALEEGTRPISKIENANTSTDSVTRKHETSLWPEEDYKKMKGHDNSHYENQTH